MPLPKTRAVGINEKGLRVGQWHQNAKLTDADVDQLLSMHEAGVGYGTLAKLWDISKSQVRNICKGKKRQQATNFKAVPV